MQVEYRNQKLRKICTDASRARKAEIEIACIEEITDYH